MTKPLLCGNLVFMTGNNSKSPATGYNPAVHFGNQVRKARRHRGWTIHDLAREADINAGHLSRIENGKRPPSEDVAIKLDGVFTERQGWFLDYYHDSESWTPPGYRHWAEHEATAPRLRTWVSGMLHGLVQTEDYARALASALSDAPAEVIAARTASRMERQRRVLYRDKPPTVWFIVDELSLYRCVGSPEIMVAQLDHLMNVAGMPDVTVQVMPAVAHPALASELIVADDAAYCEHIRAGVMYTDEETVSSLSRMINTIQAESMRASESLQLIGRTREAWASGEKVLTPAVTAGRASKWRTSPARSASATRRKPAWARRGRS